MSRLLYPCFNELWLGLLLFSLLLTFIFLAPLFPVLLYFGLLNTALIPLRPLLFFTKFIFLTTSEPIYTSGSVIPFLFSVFLSSSICNASNHITHTRKACMTPILRLLPNSCLANTYILHIADITLLFIFLHLSLLSTILLINPLLSNFLILSSPHSLCSTPRTNGTNPSSLPRHLSSPMTPRPELVHHYALIS